VELDTLENVDPEGGKHDKVISPPTSSCVRVFSSSSVAVPSTLSCAVTANVTCAPSALVASTDMSSGTVVRTGGVVSPRNGYGALSGPLSRKGPNSLEGSKRRLFLICNHGKRKKG
jgi:hypothetical protein